MNGRKIDTKEVLQLIAVGGITVSTLLIPSLPMALISVYKQWKKVNKSDVGRIIKRLEKQDMISLRENDGKIQIQITEKGQKRLLEYDFENIRLGSKRRDGKWRLIIFDIPEVKKRSRDAFRKKLLQLGFVRLQDSVFVSAFPCKKEVDFLAHFLEISDDVTLVVVDRIERGERLVFKDIHDYNNQL